MKQLGNLAIVVANHPKAMMQIYDGDVSIHIGEGTERKTISCNVWDDNYINAIIAYMNFWYRNQGLIYSCILGGELCACRFLLA